MPDFPEFENDSDVLTESETRLEKPPLYKVVLHNDDFTTMEFVVFVLTHVFLRAEADRHGQRQPGTFRVGRKGFGFVRSNVCGLAFKNDDARSKRLGKLRKDFRYSKQFREI